jgi:hypothetical protein
MASLSKAKKTLGSTSVYHMGRFVEPDKHHPLGIVFSVVRETVIAKEETVRHTALPGMSKNLKAKSMTGNITTKNSGPTEER